MNFIKEHFLQKSINLIAELDFNIAHTKTSQTFIVDDVYYHILATGSFFGKNVIIKIGLKERRMEPYLSHFLKENTEIDSNEYGADACFTASIDDLLVHAYLDYNNISITEDESIEDIFKTMEKN